MNHKHKLYTETLSYYERLAIEALRVGDKESYIALYQAARTAPKPQPKPKLDPIARAWIRGWAKPRRKSK